MKNLKKAISLRIQNSSIFSKLKLKHFIQKMYVRQTKQKKHDVGDSYVHYYMYRHIVYEGVGEKSPKQYTRIATISFQKYEICPKIKSLNCLLMIYFSSGIQGFNKKGLQNAHISIENTGGNQLIKHAKSANNSSNAGTINQLIRK